MYPETIRITLGTRHVWNNNLKGRDMTVPHLVLIAREKTTCPDQHYVGTRPVVSLHNVDYSGPVCFSILKLVIILPKVVTGGVLITG